LNQPVEFLFHRLALLGRENPVSPLALRPAGESCFQAALTVTAKPCRMPPTVLAASEAVTQVPYRRPAAGHATL
jgi:hypothetical protein